MDKSKHKPFTFTYKLISMVGTRVIHEQNDHDAMVKARAWQDEINAEYGVTVVRNDRTIGFVQ